jgi:hypothetical protein
METVSQRLQSQLAFSLTVIEAHFLRMALCCCLPAFLLLSNATVRARVTVTPMDSFDNAHASTRTWPTQLRSHNHCECVERKAHWTDHVRVTIVAQWNKRM